MRKKARISEELIGIAIAEDSTYLHQTPHITAGQISYYLLWKSYLNQKRTEEEAKQLAFLEKITTPRNNRGGKYNTSCV